jgi:hypothetical protein
MKKIFLPFGLLTLLGTLALSSCEKVADPLVPRTVSPVLVQIMGAPYQSDFAAEPTVALDGSAPAVLTARLLELDKTNLLDNTKGIDSLPLSGLKIKLTLRNGTALGEGTTDAKGLITFTKTWADLGYAKPAKGNRASLNWAGEHKGLAFTRLSAVQVK